MVEWTNNPEKDGVYWFLPGGLAGKNVRPLPRLIYTDEGGKRFVAKFGDDWDLRFDKHYDGKDDLWQLVSEPPLPERNWSEYHYVETSVRLKEQDNA